MLRLSILLLMCGLVSACHLPTFPERPNPVTNLEHPLASQPKTDAVLLWLPQTQAIEVSSYRLAVQQNLNTLIGDPTLLQRSVAAQLQLDQALLQAGGLFNSATGRFNSAGLAQALEQTYTYIKAEMPEVTDVILLNLDKQSVMVRNGIARWDDVQQKVHSTGGSVRHVAAVSLELTYLLPEQQQLTERLGLDIEPAPIGPHHRYDRVLRRAFAPYL